MIVPGVSFFSHSRPSTKPLFGMKGKGCAGSIAIGVSTGKT